MQTALSEFMFSAAEKCCCWNSSHRWPAQGRGVAFGLEDPVPRVGKRHVSCL